MKWLVITISFLLLLVLGILLWKSQHLSVQSQPVKSTGKDIWQENDDILVYLEAITQIKNLDLYLQPELKRHQVIQDSLRFFLERTDPFATYMSAEEYSKWKKSQGDQYVGIGMEIVKNKAGQVICIPYKGGPAEQAGIQAGDELITVDGQAVSGQSILAIGNLARGENNSTVKLLTLTVSGLQKNISIKRSHVSFESLSLAWVDNIAIIKIPAFTRDTKARLENSLAEVDRNKPIVIDLRGNAGGDLSAAIDSSMLFLESHKNILSIKSRQGIEKYQSGKKAMNTTSPLFIWQNEGTASAAEVFVAALTSNHRGIAIGKTSFGKGTKQEIFELSDGSALFITTGLLETPDGLLFDGKGLIPDYQLESKHSQTDDYLIKVKELLLK